MLSYLRNTFAGLNVKIAPVQTVFDNGAPGERPGDWWRDQALRMIGLPLAKIQMDGCMAHIENVHTTGVCASVVRQPDGGAPLDRVIWCAVGVGEDGPFSVIVARCFWNAERGHWEERF